MQKSFDRKDKLERFVRDNRDRFEREEPGDFLWSKIEARLQPEPTPKNTVQNHAGRWKGHISFDWRVAACVMVALGIGFLYYLNGEYGVSKDPQMALNAPAYAREFHQYSLTIDQKRNELIRLTNDIPELYREFSSDLERLESAFVRLRSELPQAPNQEALLHAMVQNLKWQIALLNQQLIIIENIKQTSQNEEATDDTPVTI